MDAGMRSLPDGFHLWWGKAFLFSAEATPKNTNGDGDGERETKTTGIPV
jgi:hypothetical protein